MRRRLAMILSAALLGSALLLPLTAMPAAADEAAVVLATEGAGSDEGLEPMSPDDEDNEFAPDEYEPNWTFRLGGKGLLSIFLIIVGYVGLMYYLRVVRPRDRSEQS